jgi:hypothetical protein
MKGKDEKGQTGMNTDEGKSLKISNRGQLSKRA